MGQGTFVAEQVAALAEPAPISAQKLDWSGFLSKRAQVVAADMHRRRAYGQLARPAPGTISFAGGMPDSTLFPTDAFRRVLNRVITQEGRELLQYYAPGGYPPLRRYLAGYLLRFGVEARPEDILIVNGSQQGFDLVARTLLDPGDLVAIEQPSYPRASRCSARSAALVPVPLTEAGLSVPHLSACWSARLPSPVLPAESTTPPAHHEPGCEAAPPR